jgi:hypothetical protein
MKLFKFY